MTIFVSLMRRIALLFVGLFVVFRVCAMQLDSDECSAVVPENTGAIVRWYPRADPPPLPEDNELGASEDASASDSDEQRGNGGARETKLRQPPDLSVWQSSDLVVEGIALPTSFGGSHPAPDRVKRIVGETALHRWIISGDIYRFQRHVVLDEIKVNVKDHEGNTPLHCAIKKNHYNMCDLLLQRKEIALAPLNDDGYTPLHCALLKGTRIIYEKLIQVMKDRNPSRLEVKSRRKKESALLCVARCATSKKESHPVNKICVLLLEAGADPNTSDGNHTPMDYAMAHKNTHLQELLLEYKVNLNAVLPKSASKSQTCVAQ